MSKEKLEHISLHLYMFYKSLFNWGSQEGTDFGGTVALRGDHMSFSVHHGQPTRDEETRKCERD
jgi:hypothetical protein